MACQKKKLLARLNRILWGSIKLWEINKIHKCILFFSIIISRPVSPTMWKKSQILLSSPQDTGFLCLWLESNTTKAVKADTGETVQLGWAQNKAKVMPVTFISMQIPIITPRVLGAQKDRLALQTWLWREMVPPSHTLCLSPFVWQWTITKTFSVMGLGRRAVDG